MKKGHRENTVGPWAEHKLEALEKYLAFYTTALKNQSFQLVYIDAFAGTPRSRVRTPENAPEPSPFLDDPESAEAQERYIEGSPLRALKFHRHFARYHFFDLDESRAGTLRELCETYPQVEVAVGNCNPLVRELAGSLRNRNIRGVAFLDPYGAHVEWETLEAIASTGTMEVIINFPVAMAINRLITRSGDIPETWTDQLNRCFGTSEWREVAYHRERDLFGEEIITKHGDVSRKLLELYVERLEKLFAYVATPRLIRNTCNGPLYYLIWAGPNKLGLKGADYILSQGEKVKTAR